MEKTINGAAIVELAAKYDSPFDESICDGFVAGIKWLMRQPLSVRLTEKERARIREIYANEAFKDAPDRDLASIVVDQVLTEIFGKEMFKEKEIEL